MFLNQPVVPLPDWMWPTPPLVSGRFYAGPPWACGVNTMGTAAGQLYLVPFFNPRPITWATIAIEVTTFSAGNCMLGYYDTNDQGLPGKLQKQFGTVSTGANAVVGLTINEYVKQGLYWLLAGFDAGPSVRSVTAQAMAETPTLSLNNGSGTNLGLKYQNQSDAIVALPGNWAMISSNQAFVATVPRILIGI